MFTYLLTVLHRCLFFRAINTATLSTTSFLYCRPELRENGAELQVDVFPDARASGDRASGVRCCRRSIRRSQD